MILVAAKPYVQAYLQHTRTGNNLSLACQSHWAQSQSCVCVCVCVCVHVLKHNKDRCCEAGEREAEEG